MTDDPRALNAEEHRIINLILAVEFDGVDELRNQVDHVSVVGRCECGCPTVYLTTPGAASPVGKGGPVPVDAVVEPTGEDGHGGHLLLLVEDGRMASLEYAWVTEERPQSWPPARRLRVGPAKP